MMIQKHRVSQISRHEHQIYSIDVYVFYTLFRSIEIQIMIQKHRVSQISRHEHQIYSIDVYVFYTLFRSIEIQIMMTTLSKNTVSFSKTVLELPEPAASLLQKALFYIQTWTSIPFRSVEYKFGHLYHYIKGFSSQT